MRSRLYFSDEILGDAHHHIESIFYPAEIVDSKGNKKVLLFTNTDLASAEDRALQHKELLPKENKWYNIKARLAELA